MWEVKRSVFRWEIQQASKQTNTDNVRFLKRVNLFKPLLSHEIQLVSDALEVQRYAKNTIVIKEGEIGDKFYVIRKGTCQWLKSNGENGEMQAGYFFGERALRTKDKRAATVTTVTKCTLLEMTKTDFELLLGPVIEIVDESIEKYRRLTQKFQKDFSHMDHSNNNNNNGGKGHHHKHSGYQVSGIYIYTLSLYCMYVFV